MMRKSKSRKRRRKPGWWASMDGARRRRIVRRGGLSFLVVIVVLAVTTGMAGLETHVQRQLRERIDRPTLAFVDLPEPLKELALGDLQDSVSELLASDWTDAQLCRTMAARLASVGWVDKVTSVRRRSNGRFEVSGCYRIPVAMIQQGAEFLLTDGHGVRLPGTYRYDPWWTLVQGVAGRAPEPGEPWEGGDLRAALTILAVLAVEPFGDQITAVLVENVGGRRDPQRSHIELATDRAGGRIRWGSAPGFELEENSVEQKLAILRENYRQTGRADTDHAVIDISTFPDRFTIPG